MSTIVRPDGVELSWRVTGEGPLVVICENLFSIPDALDGLEADLAADHTVLRYDPRGVGQSTRSGPYDLDTDVEDLVAIVEGARGAGGAVAIGPANGGVIAVRCASRRPDLVSAVVAPTGAPVAAPRLEGGLAGSEQVLRAIGTQLASDYRGLVRSVTTTGNPQASVEEHRQRVDAQIDYRPQEAAEGRWDAYFHSDATDESRGLGDRLWILLHPGMPWWPVELAESLRQVLPEAHVEVIEDGPLSRPDLTANVVRGITRAA
jgi:pimeloyl-ACP methyl ester carboxylesterase